MSQEKVDRRKYEKHNRKKLERQRKIKFAVKCIVAAIVIGAMIGVPLGIDYYKSIPKFVGDSTLENFVGEYMKEAHAADIPDFSAAEYENTEETTEEATEETSEDTDDSANEADSEETSEE